MRVLLVCPMPPSATGPGAIPRVLDAQLEGLRARHDVTVVTVAGPEEWQIDAVHALRAEGVDVRAALRSHPQGMDRWRRRGRLAYAWGVRRMPWRSAWFWEPSLQAALDRCAAEKVPDVIQAEDNAVGLYRYGRARATVLTEHEVRQPRPVRRAALMRLSAPTAALGEVDWHRWRRYQLSAWRRFDRVQVFTRRDAALVQEMAPDLGPRIRVNPFGVRLPAPCDPARAVAGRLVFVGNYSHFPNVDAARWLAEEIMPLLVAQAPDARLALVGDQAPDAVRRLAGPGIDVIGRVDDPRTWLEQAEVVVAPVRTGGGMRMKVLEAMAAGKAVVATPRGVEGMDQDVPIRVASEPGPFAQECADLIRDPAARAGLGSAARSYAVERHGPDAYARRLETIYGEILEGDAGRGPPTRG